MANNATIKIGIDIDSSGFSKLQSQIQKLNLGEAVTKDLEKSFKNFDKLMKDIQTKGSALGADSPVSAHKEVEALLKQAAILNREITKEVQQQIHAKMQAKGVSIQAVQLAEREIKSLQARAQVLQKDKAYKQEELNALRTEAQIRKDLDKIQKDIANREKEGNQHHQAVAALERRKQKEIELNRELDERLKIQAEINAIQQKIDKATADIEGKRRVGQDVQEELKLLEQLNTAKDQRASKIKEVTELQKVSTTAAREGLNKQIESQGRVAAGVETIISKMKRLAEYTIAAFALRHIRQFAQEGLRFVAELDKSLTEIATVTGQTRQQMWGMAEEFNRIGRELGKTTNEITQASVIFYRQGLNTNQVLQMVRASTISAAIANTDAGEASNRLTAAIRGYGLEASAAMGISDKLAALAAKSASSFDELSYAIKLVA